MTTRKNSILIIDDDKNCLKILRYFLINDFDVIFAQGGVQGIRKAQQYLPDLILLDLIMPFMNGLEALKQLKEIQTTQDIPVIVLYNDGCLQLAYAAIEQGAYDCIRKPFDYFSVETRVKNTLKQNKALINQTIL